MTYHYIVTLSFTDSLYSTDGTYTTRPGETRMQAYRAIVAAEERDARASGHSGAAVTAFFSLEPNDLAAGAR